MEIFISIGDRLKEVRKAMGLSQSEFAEIAALAGVAGATRQSQANYEKGRQMPAAAYLAAIGNAGADLQYILTGVGREETDQPNLRSTANLPPDEQLLLDAYRGLSPAKKKQLLAELLTGSAGKKPAKAGSGIVVSGSGNRTAGENYHEKE